QDPLASSHRLLACYGLSFLAVCFSGLPLLQQGGTWQIVAAIGVFLFFVGFFCLAYCLFCSGLFDVYNLDF
ncbi:hypothetical protein, partial [Mucilaginibacter sp. 10I4]|uniref:hypothetical protein n=1 Tax=Mucilaginibacter sp. 10I4 TaxID=3048580 RepID=UPI002B2313E8